MVATYTRFHAHQRKCNIQSINAYRDTLLIHCLPAPFLCSLQNKQKRYATSPINITLPEVGDVERLSYDRTIIIDTTAPYVTNVTSTQPNGTYTVGATIGIAVQFNSPVVVYGYDNCIVESIIDSTASSNSSGEDNPTDDGVFCEDLPVIKLDSSGSNEDANATYSGGNGTSKLVFAYEASTGYVCVGGFVRVFVNEVSFCERPCF